MEEIITLLKDILPLPLFTLFIGFYGGYLLINHMKKETINDLRKDLERYSGANQKYKIETAKMRTNTLYEVTEISNAMVLEIPPSWNIRLLGSYEKPTNLEAMLEIKRDTTDSFSMLNDIPKYLYLKCSQQNHQHIIVKGFSIKEEIFV